MVSGLIYEGGAHRPEAPCGRWLLGVYHPLGASLHRRVPRRNPAHRNKPLELRGFFRNHPFASRVSQEVATRPSPYSPGHSASAASQPTHSRASPSRCRGS